MQDVVLEILELGVWRLGAFQEVFVVDQEQRLPRLAIVPADQRKRIESNVMMGRAAAVIPDHAFEQGHGRVLRTVCDSIPRNSAKMVNALLTLAGRLAGSMAA
jgi:hypothetical protein